MSLMVNPVSSVSFRAQESAPQSAEDILSRPGAFARPEPQVNQPAKKKHTFLKTVAGILVAAGVIAGGLHYLPKKFPEIFKVTDNISKMEGGMLTKIKAYLTTGVAKGAEYVGQGADFIVKYANKGWKALKGLFKSKPAS